MERSADPCPIRLARLDEVSRLGEIEDEAGTLFSGLGLIDEALDGSFPTDELGRLVVAGQVWVVCAADDRPVGMAIASVRDGAAYLEEMDVLPRYGRRGLGSRLLGTVCDWARACGHPAVTLSTFRDVPWNGAFYRKSGFRELSPAEWTPGMRAIRAKEARRGLRVEARVFMRRELGGERVRPAQPSDRGRLLELWERSVRATHRFLKESEIVALRPLVAEELASDAFDWWVLVSSGEEPIGFLGLANQAIEALFIDPDHQGRGAGKALVAHAQELAPGALTVDVNQQNESALRFYEALGFVVIGSSPLDTGGRPFPILNLRRAAPSAGCHSDVPTMRPPSSMSVAKVPSR